MRGTRAAPWSAISHTRGAPGGLGARGLSWSAGVEGLKTGPPPPPGRELTFSEAGAGVYNYCPPPRQRRRPGVSRGGGGGEAGTTAAATAASAAEQAGWEEEAETRLPEGKSPPLPAYDWTAQTPWRRGALLRLRGQPSAQEAS